MQTFWGLAWIAASGLAVLLAMFAISVTGHLADRVGEDKLNDQERRQISIVMVGMIYVILYVLFALGGIAHFLWPD